MVPFHFSSTLDENIDKSLLSCYHLVEWNQFLELHLMLLAFNTLYNLLYRQLPVVLIKPCHFPKLYLSEGLFLERILGTKCTWLFTDQLDRACIHHFNRSAVCAHESMTLSVRPSFKHLLL